MNSFLSRIPSLFRAQATAEAATKPDAEPKAAPSSSGEAAAAAGTTAAAPAAAATPTLSQRLGGPAAVAAVVDIFYVKILGDPALIPFFEGVDMRKQKIKQAQFMTYVFGGPNSYKGRDLRKAHLPLIKEKGLNETHFDLVAGHLVASLQEAGVPQQLIDEVVAKVVPTKDIIFKPAPGELEDSAPAAEEEPKKEASPPRRCPFSGAAAPADPLAPSSCPGAALAAAAAAAEQQQQQQQAAAEPQAAAAAEPTLLEQLGGKPAVAAVVDLFYDRMMKDGELAPFFAGVPMIKQRAKQAQFLTYVFGGATAYKGRDLRKVHLPLIRDKGLNETHFGMVAGHLVAALQEAGVAQPLIDTVMAKVAATKDLIFQPAPGELAASSE